MTFSAVKIGPMSTIRQSVPPWRKVAGESDSSLDTSKKKKSYCELNPVGHIRNLLEEKPEQVRQQVF